MVRRVEKWAKLYKFDGKDIKYKVSNDAPWKIVPHPSTRVDLINKAHLIGHFQVQSTLDRLRTDYYWKKMKDQCNRTFRVHHKVSVAFQ